MGRFNSSNLFNSCDFFGMWKYVASESPPLFTVVDAPIYFSPGYPLLQKNTLDLLGGPRQKKVAEEPPISSDSNLAPIADSDYRFWLRRLQSSLTPEHTKSDSNTSHVATIKAGVYGRECTDPETVAIVGPWLGALCGMDICPYCP